MTEVDPRLQPLNQTEHIALGVAGRIPPAFATVADDQDLALAAPVFQAEFGALLPVEHPGRQCTLEHDGAMHLVAQVFDFWVAHGRSLRLSAGAWLSGLGLLFAPALPVDREAGGLQGRAERAGASRQPLAARPVLAVRILFSFAHRAKARRRWREEEIPATVVASPINGQWKADGSRMSA